MLSFFLAGEGEGEGVAWGALHYSLDASVIRHLVLLFVALRIAIIDWKEDTMNFLDQVTISLLFMVSYC